MRDLVLDGSVEEDIQFVEVVSDNDVRVGLADYGQEIAWKQNKCDDFIRPFKTDLSLPNKALSVSIFVSFISLALPDWRTLSKSKGQTAWEGRQRAVEQLELNV